MYEVKSQSSKFCLRAHPATRKQGHHRKSMLIRPTFNNTDWMTQRVLKIGCKWLKVIISSFTLLN